MSRNYSPVFKSYQDAVEYMGSKWDRPYPVGSPRNTRVKRRIASFSPGKAYEAITIRYHWTSVITYTPNHMILNTNGWRSNTTKKRINDSLIGARVWQRDFTWYITGQNGTFRFHDGMKVSYQGEIYSGVVAQIK